MISRIIEGEVSVVSRNRRLRLIILALLDTVTCSLSSVNTANIEERSTFKLLDSRNKLDFILKVIVIVLVYLKVFVLQLVWKGTARVGVGLKKIVTSDGFTMTYIVARYSPPGNIDGLYADNVKPLQTTL